MAKRIFWIIVGLAAVWLALCIVCMAGSIAYNSLNPPKPTPVIRSLTGTGVPAPTDTPAPPRTRTGEATRDLGQQPTDFGSQNQAQALLDLINTEPGKADYTITYQTPDGTVLIGCNFEQDTLIRIHQETNDNRQEVWQGYILERLQNAAAGGSLNDTPAGKIFAIED